MKEYGAIYYSDKLNRVIVISPTTFNNVVEVKGISKSTNEYMTSIKSSDIIQEELLKEEKQYELVGYL